MYRFALVIYRFQEKKLYKKEGVQSVVGRSLEQMYKAPDVVLQALALLKTRGVKL